MVAQFVDPAVSRAKFDREIAEFRAMEPEYRRRGWLLTHAEFPEVVVVMAAPKLKPAAIVTGVLFSYENYDAVPPSVQLIDPFIGVPFKNKELPTQLLRGMPQQQIQLPGLPENARMVVQGAQPLMQAHGPEDIPFLCLAGVRAYHEHPAHTGDSWELHRASGAGRLVRLLEVIHRYGVANITGFAVNLVPQVALDHGQPQP